MNDESDSRPTASISVIDPLSRAIDWTREVLFRPFSIEKWLVLGFCAWLSLLGDCGGGNGSSGGRGSGDLQDIRRGMHGAWDWLIAHLLPVLFVGVVVVAVIIVIWLLLLWLSSRGKFMFLDGVVNDRAAVVEPWRRFRPRGNSLFGFRIVVGLLAAAAVVSVLALAVCLIWFGLEARDPDPLLIAIMIFAVAGILAIVIPLALLELAINDFLVPLMYLRELRVMAAWGELLRLFSFRPGAFILYVLVRFVIGIVVFAIVLLACCLTCCIVLLPYIGTVILLPLHVFVRAYSYYFIDQFGPPDARLAPESRRE